MSGFPLRSLLQNFGPKLRDARPIENPEIETGQRRLNLLESTITGVNLISPRASVVARYDPSPAAFIIYHQEEAWNARHAQAHPVLERQVTGLYTYTFASSYLTEDGESVPISVVAARANVFGAGGINSGTKAWCQVTSPTVVTISISDDSNAGVDARFWLEVF
jgi:hypothetical protein